MHREFNGETCMKAAILKIKELENNIKTDVSEINL
jgi:hypothetical protein